MPSENMAKGISGLACVLTFLLGLYLVRGGCLIFHGWIVMSVAVAHVFLSLGKQYVGSFRIAGCELIAFIGVVLLYLYPDPELVNAGKVLIPVNFKIAVWLWLASVAVLFPMAAICFTVAKRIERCTPNEL